MKYKRGLFIVAIATIVLGLIYAYGEKQKNEKMNSNVDSKERVIKIATQTPLSGGSASIGKSMKLGAQLALEEQVAKFKELGFRLELTPYDDQGDPKIGVANAQLLIADSTILGVVGHFNSGVTIPASEIYENYTVAMVTPGSTATKVTDRKYKSVNRIIARDDFQGPAGAEFTITNLQAKSIFLVHDKTEYGQGIANSFKEKAEKLGAEIIGYEGINVGEIDFTGLLDKVITENPDVIYFGGVYAEGGLLIKQARAKGITVPIVGGDGMDSRTLVEIAGDSIKNVYITSVAADTRKTDKGKIFAQKYKEKFSENIDAYSAYGYDSMGIILKAIEGLIRKDGDNIPTREQVRDAVRSTRNYKGVVSNVSFNEVGDNKQAGVYIYQFNETLYPGEYIETVKNRK